MWLYIEHLNEIFEILTHSVNEVNTHFIVCHDESGNNRYFFLTAEQDYAILE